METRGVNSLRLCDGYNPHGNVCPDFTQKSVTENDTALQAYPVFHSNPNFQNRNPNYQQQQYFQRPPMQNQQQQQWLRRIPIATDSPANEVEKTVQSEVVDSRYIFYSF